METIRLNMELDELQFIINDLKDQVQELRDEKRNIEERYYRLVNKITEARIRKNGILMTPEQLEIVELFRMEL